MKQFSLLSFTLAALMFGQAKAEAEMDEGVLVLTDSNFDEEIAKHDFLLVEFYAPWCGHCKQLTPEYIKAADRLKNNDPSYYIGKVDATANDELAQRFGIKGFPTLFFFKHGQKVEYNGGRKEPEISDWVLKKVGPAHKPATCDETKDITRGAKFALTYFGVNEGDAFAAFESVANGEQSEKLTFITNDNADCATEFGASFPGITLSRHFDEPLLQAAELTSAALNSWIGASMIPTIQEFNEDSIEGIFGERKQAIFLFRNQASSGEYEQVFSQAASAMKGQIVFVTSDVEDGIQGRLGEFVGVTADMLPTIRVLDPADGMKKFSYDNKIADLTVESIQKFVDDFKAGNLAPFLKSEPVPETQEGPVHLLVGKNFQTDVLDSDDDVLVKFYAPWCGHCKALAPAWEEVAAELKDVAGLKIADFDATMNEADGVEVQGYPTLKFYKRGQKSSPVSYEAGRTKEEIIEWLKENSAAYKAHLGVAHDEL